MTKKEIYNRLAEIHEESDKSAEEWFAEWVKEHPDSAQSKPYATAMQFGKVKSMVRLLMIEVETSLQYEEEKHEKQMVCTE